MNKDFNRLLNFFQRTRETLRKVVRAISSRILKAKSLLPLAIFLRLGNLVLDYMLELAAILGRSMSRYRIAKGFPRSVWGTTPLLTLPINARADRMLGLESDSLVFVTYQVSSDFDVNLSEITSFFAKRHPTLLPIWFKLVLIWALIHYDIFHYFYDRGILIPDYPTEPDQKLMIGISEKELSLLDRSEKRLYCYTYGSDVRTRESTTSLGEFNCCMDCPDPGRYCICSTAGSQRNLERIRKSARAMLATTDNINDVKGCRPFHYWAVDLNKIPFVGAAPIDGPLVIAHAPNHSVFKGTRFLEAIVSKLVLEGAKIELHMISGVANERVLELFAKADIVADQFITGGYGYTALEGMAAGKPVLCFLRDMNWIAAPAECPIINVNPGGLEETIRWCIDNRKELAEIGRRGRSYIGKHYSIPAVASRLGELYIETGNFPSRLEDRIRRKMRANHVECA